jgi:hypothetical protein
MQKQIPSPPWESLSPPLAASADRHARPVGEHARRNVHRLQLLEQQLGRVRDVDLRNLGLVLAGAALERLLGEVPKNILAVFIPEK